MGETRRFISRGFSWTNGAVILDRRGREFDVMGDADLIAGIINDGVNAGGLVIEVPTCKQLKNAAVDLVIGEDQIRERVRAEAARLAAAMIPEAAVDFCEPITLAQQQDVEIPCRKKKPKPELKREQGNG